MIKIKNTSEALFRRDGMKSREMVNTRLTEVCSLGLPQEPTGRTAWQVLSVLQLFSWMLIKWCLLDSNIGRKEGGRGTGGQGLAWCVLSAINKDYVCPGPYTWGPFSNRRERI